jgi:hypothetical protein
MVIATVSPLAGTGGDGAVSHARVGTNTQNGGGQQTTNHSRRVAG